MKMVIMEGICSGQLLWACLIDTQYLRKKKKKELKNQLDIIKML